MKVLKNDKNQIRSGWKIGIVYLSYFLTTLILTFIFSSIYGGIVLNKNPEFLSDKSKYMEFIDEQFSNINYFPGVCLYLISCICMIFCVILLWKKLDKRKIKDIGLSNIKNSWKDLIIGLVIGAISFTIVAIILLATKSVELVNSFSQPNFSDLLIVQLIVFIFVGINEELFCRGYCMTVLKQTKKSWIPIVVSSILFALMHSMNDGISLLAYINLFLYGIAMGGLFIKTKNIWMGIGYHITWNYFQGDVFGFLVSGQHTNSIYNIKTISSNVINGGSFGPEGGLVVTILLLITIVIIYKFCHSREL